MTDWLTEEECLHSANRRLQTQTTDESNRLPNQQAPNDSPLCWPVLLFIICGCPLWFSTNLFSSMIIIIIGFSVLSSFLSSSSLPHLKLNNFGEVLDNIIWNYLGWVCVFVEARIGSNSSCIWVFQSLSASLFAFFLNFLLFLPLLSFVLLPADKNITCGKTGKKWQKKAWLEV